MIQDYFKVKFLLNSNIVGCIFGIIKKFFKNFLKYNYYNVFILVEFKIKKLMNEQRN